MARRVVIIGGGSDILVAVLEEDHAASAVAYAADVARERNARLTLFTVVPRMPVVMCPLALPYDPRTLEEVSARTLRTASQHVPPDVPARLRAHCKTSGARVALRTTWCRLGPWRRRRGELHERG